MLFNTLRWRVPAKDQFLSDVGNRISLDDLPIRILANGLDIRNNQEMRVLLESSEAFQDSLRFTLPAMPFYNDKSYEDLIKNSYVHTNPSVISVLGDVPFIEDLPGTPEEFGNFIFPLNNTDTFIYNRSGIGAPQPGFYYNKDLAVFHVAERYVACKDRRHLESTASAYDHLNQEGQTDSILKFMFRFT